MRFDAKFLNIKFAGEPEVGILFVYNGTPWIDGTSLRNADNYGHMKMQTHDHIDFWDQLRLAHLVPPDLEYDEVPRGRVTYDTQEKQFYLFLDRCIIRDKKMVGRVEREMNLPSNTKVKTDTHYMCPVCLAKLEEDFSS